jgi:hypothetical protein
MTDFAAIAATWPDDWRIRFEERAAIREYDGGEDRRTAERMAFAECGRLMKAAT